MSAVIGWLAEQPLLVLMLIMALGFFVGRIRIGSFSLGVARSSFRRPHHFGALHPLRAPHSTATYCVGDGVDAFRLHHWSSVRLVLLPGSPNRGLGT